MTSPVDKAKQVRAAGCSCLFLIVWLPVAVVGAIIVWALLKSLF